MSINNLGKRGRFTALLISFLIIFLTFLWTVASAYAQQTTKKNFLWSLKTDKATVYLLGSMHLLKSDSYPLDKNIEAAYRDCTKVVFETDIDGMNTTAVQEQMMALALYPEGQTLRQSISPETYSMLEKKATEAGLPMEQFSRLRPWMCATMLVLLELQKMGFDLNYGIDKYFFNKAQQDKKETIFLESIEYHLNLLASMDASEEESFLQQTLKDLEVVKSMLTDIVSAWETGDAARLESIGMLSYKDYPEIYDRFLIKRNKAWVSTIERLIGQGGNTFVVVGAGHLVGPDNLLQLLRGRGYTVVQIPAHAEVAAVSPEDLAHALYIRSGMEGQLRSLPLAIHMGFDQACNQGDRFQQVPKDLSATIKELLAESFAADNFNQIVRRHMEAQLDQNEMQGILDWLNSPFGRKCSDLFKTSLTPTTSAEFQEFLIAIQKSPPLSARRQLIQELARATKTMETSLEIAVATKVVVTTVITATLPPLRQRPFSEILDEVEKDRPLLEPRVDQQITSLLLYLCRSFSDAELEQYITFAKSSIGAHYYNSLYNGIKLALMDSNIRFGSAMADMQWQREHGAGAR